VLFCIVLYYNIICFTNFTNILYNIYYIYYIYYILIGINIHENHEVLKLLKKKKNTLCVNIDKFIIYFFLKLILLNFNIF